MAKRGDPAPIELISEIEKLIEREGSAAGAAKRLGISGNLMRSVLSGLQVQASTCALLRERLAKVKP